MARSDKNAELRASCRDYIVRTNSLPAAQELAAQEGFTANFSVWIAAMGEIINLPAVSRVVLRDTSTTPKTRTSAAKKSTRRRRQTRSG